MDTKEVHSHIKLGLSDRNWYSETTDLFIELYGLDQLGLVSTLFAATSINSSLKSNIRLFRRAYYELSNGLPIGRYLPNIQMQLNQIRHGLPLTGRKIRSFAAAMAGNPNAVVVDIWLLRAFNADKRYMRHTGPHAGKERSGGATDKQYDFIESWVRDYAFEHGYEPRQISAAIWSGVRTKTTGDRLTRYDLLLRQQEYSMFESARHEVQIETTI